MRLSQWNRVRERPVVLPVRAAGYICWMTSALIFAKVGAHYP